MGISENVDLALFLLLVRRMMARLAPHARQQHLFLGYWASSADAFSRFCPH
jgi:hypothetical protein